MHQTGIRAKLICCPDRKDLERCGDMKLHLSAPLRLSPGEEPFSTFTAVVSGVFSVTQRQSACVFFTGIMSTAQGKYELHALCDLSDKREGSVIFLRRRVRAAVVPMKAAA